MATFSRAQRHGLPGRQGISDAGFFKANGYAPVPQMVQALVTLECPLKCPHCLAQGDGERIMSPALFDTLAAQAAALGVRELLVTGGEPLAHPDFPGIVESLRRNRLEWTLNTAAMPDAPARKVLEVWPPSFVAVSLDGPEFVHDSFRGLSGSHEEALASIGFFSGLAPFGVAAGTTVTTVNFPYLEETFPIVLASGATAWGIHLLVPEGRAKERQDLFLSRRQLKELLRFVAAKRNHFEVTFADEMGYCGAWESLVRPVPFFCGAGRTHCVVLPDGTLTPCSTCDASAGAGNLKDAPLAEIWKNGFREQREWRPRDACAACRFACACKGGCWLQRRNGTQCFKDVWSDIPGLSQAGQAAVLAISLGLTVAAPREGVADQPSRPAATRQPVHVAPAPDRLSQDEQDILMLEQAIILREGGQIHPGSRGDRWTIERPSLKNDLGHDPAVEYFLLWDEGKGPADLTAWCQSAERALQTKQRSLSFICLLWRNAMDICIAGEGPAKRTRQEREALLRGMALLKNTGDAWHREIIARRLDPFLRADSANGIYRSMMCKGRPPDSAYLAYDTAVSRGFATHDRRDYLQGIGTASISNTLASIVPFGKSMELACNHDNASRPMVMRAGQEQPAPGRLEVFDILVVPAGGTTITFPIEDDRARTPAKAGISPLAGTAPDAKPGLKVDLPAGAELCYADVLLLACEQNPRQAFELLRLRGGRNAMPVSGSGDPKRLLKSRLAQLYLF